jgi:hypothetical protein
MLARDGPHGGPYNSPAAQGDGNSNYLTFDSPRPLYPAKNRRAAG